MVRSKYLRLIAILLVAMFGSYQAASACTGISFTAKDGSKVIARTMEWGTFVMESRYIVVPRGHSETAMTPSGTNGMKIVAKYGYVGIGVLKDNLIAEGMNEKGLAGELFYFPGYGQYEEYDETKNSTSFVDAQFLSWVLSNFASIDEMEKALKDVHVVPYGHGFGAVHFNVADASGRHVVVEFLNGKPCVFENKIGVITNAPSFDWQMTNLNNYVNIFAGAAPTHEVVPGVTLKPFGIGSASLGLPGDMTPPSRFVRAAFFLHTALQPETGYGAVMQSFQILNNFDVPIGTEFGDKKEIPDGMLSASQWTAALDLKRLKFYYRTEWNCTIRCIDLRTIDFGKVKYQMADLDKKKEHPMEYIQIR